MPCNIMSGEDYKPEVTTSVSDVYSMPIALGFPGSSDVGTSTTMSSSLPVEGPQETDQNSSSIVSKMDVTDLQAKRGRCGLYNLGNTCFMNSGLQCLMNTIPLITFLLDYHQTGPACDQTLLGHFRQLFAKIWSGKFTILHPRDFKQALGLYHPQFQDFRQHDCQEFLALLLDTLHEQLNFKKVMTNRNTDAGSVAKQPIRFEQNINNKISASHKQEKKENQDQSKNAVSPGNSALTYDNMKRPFDGGNVSEFCGGFVENSPGKSDREKLSLLTFTLNQISEDSNHSSVSEHSSDSDQCSVIKNLKLRSSPIASQSADTLSHTDVEVGKEASCCVSSSADLDVSLTVNDFSSKKGDGEGVKRVHSLQDIQTEVDAATSSGDIGQAALTKSCSDNDLVMKASADVEKSDLENLRDLAPDSSQFCVKNNVSDCDGSEVNVEMKETSAEPVVLNNAISTTNVPSLEDLYAKETKTLNTNVLASEYMNNSVNVDSEKFAKHDNTAGRPDLIEEEDIMNSVLEAAGKKDEFEADIIKDVNIRADKKSRSPKGACASSLLAGSEKEDCFGLNSVKRMKFEGTEKNLQMQEMVKINKKKLLFESLKSNKRSNVDVNMPSTSASAGAIDSDMESFTMDDQDQDVYMSEEEEEDGTDVHEPMSLAEGASYTAAEVLAAEEAWQKYLTNNDSIIVDSFQGQFKSTVVCAECNQVSVTFEPFMYLSVPIPHAMERQLCVTFISPFCEPTQYLLTMHKQDKIQKVKQELCSLIGRMEVDLVVTEVHNRHISRILEDNTMLRYINDTTRRIYAFELEPCPLDSLTDSASTVSSSLAQDQLTSTSQVSTTAVASSSTSSSNTQDDIFNQMGSFSVGSSTFDSQAQDYQSVSYPREGYADQGTFSRTDINSDIMGTGLWHWGQEPDKNIDSVEAGDSHMHWPAVDSTTSPQGFDSTEGNQGEKGDNSVSSTSAGVSGEWKSCAICLEELPDNELMVHTTCGGTFCPSCLEMSVQHYKDTGYNCPVCSTPADITEDFVPLESAANHKPKTRIVTTPISYRCELDQSGAPEPFLFSHPNLLNLPSNLTGQHLYTCIDKILPLQATYRVVLTDAQGLHCSRCLYMDHCPGCEIPRDGEVILRPGDHLTITMPSVSEDQVRHCQHTVDHSTMADQRSREPTTLLDCFSAFTQSEELDEHNPWFCPHCKKNQQAKKTMTVWQYPDTLIIHLKRFVFHELSSTKIDSKVVFPLDHLNLDNFISGPKTRSLQYSLYSLVCHFGGSNSGHYTAYCKHAVDGQWYYYNDETVSPQTPGEEEHTSTYVLFYRRIGTDKALQIQDDLDIHFETDISDNLTSAAPSVLYQPPEGELTLSVQQMLPSASCHQRSPSDHCHQVSPSTSCHELVPSGGSCDLVVSSYGMGAGEESFEKGEGHIKQMKAEHGDFEEVRAELAEADSTGATLDFYN